MRIRLDDLRGPEIALLLQEHLREMYDTSPPESVHALDLDRLREPDISFWTIWDDDDLAGCGALKQLSATHAEIKSMRTAHTFRRRGVGALMLQHILDEARSRNYQHVSLETGSMDYFAAARQLYAKFGFTECGPFEGYVLDPYSVFMTLQLHDSLEDSR